jgi:hypothetical protein
LIAPTIGLVDVRFREHPGKGNGRLWQFLAVRKLGQLVDYFPIRVFGTAIDLLTELIGLQALGTFEEKSRREPVTSEI